MIASGPTQYLTLVVNGSTDAIYESSTLGGTTNLLASGAGVEAFATDLPQIPEPTTFTLMGAAGLSLFAFRRFAKNNVSFSNERLGLIKRGSSRYGATAITRHA